MSQLRNGWTQKWDFCDGILPRGINPTDIDLCIEAGRGRFLILEGKQPGEAMPTGQRKALERLAALDESFMVIEFVGIKPDTVQKWRKLPDLFDVGWHDTTTEEFNTMIQRWFDWAEAR